MLCRGLILSCYTRKICLGRHWTRTFSKRLLTWNFMTIWSVGLVEVHKYLMDECVREMAYGCGELMPTMGRMIRFIPSVCPRDARRLLFRAHSIITLSNYETDTDAKTLTNNNEITQLTAILYEYRVWCYNQCNKW
jgi:hypothetical protein